MRIENQNKYNKINNKNVDQFECENNINFALISFCRKIKTINNVLSVFFSKKNNQSNFFVMINVIKIQLNDENDLSKHKNVEFFRIQRKNKTINVVSFVLFYFEINAELNALFASQS